MNILITGASGFVGSGLVEKLIKRKNKVRVLTRNVPRAALSLGDKPEYIKWDPSKEITPARAFKDIDVIVNLMGENIAAGRWSEKQKRKIYDSRIIGTKNLINGLIESGEKIDAFVSTSAIGIYGNRSEAEPVNEDADINSSDFLSKVCVDWEKVVHDNLPEGIRSCILRVGVVLGKDGGALEKMELPFKMGAGGVVGSGKQVMSWIHLDDLRNLYIDAIEKDHYKGIINAVSPSAVTNKVFTKCLGKVLKRPTFIPLPSFAAEAAFGEMSTILLDGQKVIPEKALEFGFDFKYNTLEKALEAIF